MTEAEKQEWIQKVDTALDDIRPYLKVDGGNIEVVDINDDMKVSIKWLGACESCSMSAMTMRAGIEETLKTKLPQITAVEAVNGTQKA